MAKELLVKFAERVLDFGQSLGGFPAGADRGKLYGQLEPKPPTRTEKGISSQKK